MGRSIYPVPGTPKPVQRGGTSVGIGQTDITIASVNMNKTRINILGPGMGSSISQAPGFTVELINSTTMRITSNLGGGGSVTLRYEILEDY